MRRHRKTRKEKRRQRKIIIASMIGVLFVMSAGYSAFNTNLNISAKGNILEKKITINELKNNVVTSGDGLYKDNTIDGNYIYKGSNPNNYIIFNNELWRILSLENDNTLRLIRSESIGNIRFDSAESRPSSTSSYCVSNGNGCNAWAATSNLINKPSIFKLYYPNGNSSIDTTSYSGTVTKDAELNTYLNNTYYNSLLTDSKNYMLSHYFNVGTPGGLEDNENIKNNVLQEASYKWNGKVGLMYATDFLKATTNSSCTSLKVGGNNYTKSICSENNWLYDPSNNQYTISPVVDSGNCRLWYIDKLGFVWRCNSYSEIAVRPVVFISSDIKLSGNGLENDPYIIVS